MKRIEEGLASAESRRDALNAALSGPEVSADYEKVLSLTGELEALQAQIEALESEWLELEEL